MKSEPRPESGGDILMITFDALRFDVAEKTWREGRTPFLQSLLPQGWEERHSPGNFTLAAHTALFAGFWPTPVKPGTRSRPFALRFPGSRSIGSGTMLLDGETIIDGFRRQGYRSLCIGGVGFFNRRTPLGSTMPNLFDEAHWEPAFGVAERHSTRDQIAWACSRISEFEGGVPLFIFLNVSATHPPTRGYIKGARHESTETQAAALAYVDRQLPPLFDALGNRRIGGRAFLMSDHGTLFGDDGYEGHRIGHTAVWTVPYGEYHWGVTP